MAENIMVPEWVKSFSGDSVAWVAWETILHGHIHDGGTHFRGKVRSWILIN